MYLTLSNKQYRKTVAIIDRKILWNDRMISDDHVMFFFEVGHIYISRTYVCVKAYDKEYHADLIRSFKDLKAAIKMAELASLLQ